MAEEEVVKGKYLYHSENFGFVYEYTCSRCQKEFKSRGPEANRPVLCHQCFTGSEGCNRPRNRRAGSRKNQK